MNVITIIDHKLRVDLDQMPDPAITSMICDALTIPNMEKLLAEKNGRWGWERMPDYISLYELHENQLIMPRGFLKSFAEGLTLSGGHTIQIDDRRCWNPLLRIGTRPQPRPWQERAIETMRADQQGIWKAPAGSGKTVGILCLLRELAVNGLVIVNTKDIMWQWQERAREFLGEHYPVGQIGDGKFELSPYLTIATAQTLNSRYEELDAAGFFDGFSFVCLDECHHATADTYNRIMDRFNATFRLGVSATPDKTGDFNLAKNVLGPIIHETRPREVPTLMKPEVHRIPTRLSFAFRGGGRNSNYAELLDKLIRDPDRNAIIVRRIIENQGHHQLVISKRIEHLDIIEAMLLQNGCTDPIVKIRGKDDNAARKEAKALAEVQPCVLLSTLADEAMDIPRLDRMHLTFPQKNPGLVTQQVGRVEREHQDKKDAIIFDYADMNIGPLEKQWRVRRFEVYEVRGYKIVTVRDIPKEII